MNTTSTYIPAGTITVRGLPRMAFRRDGKTFYFPSIRGKAVEASVEAAATWED